MPARSKKPPIRRAAGAVKRAGSAIKKAGKAVVIARERRQVAGLMERLLNGDYRAWAILVEKYGKAPGAMQIVADCLEPDTYIPPEPRIRGTPQILKAQARNAARAIIGAKYGVKSNAER